MVTIEKLADIFKRVFEDEINVEGLNEQTNLREDIGINSIGMLYMAMALEEEFEIKFTNDEFSSIVTVKDVIVCIEQKLK